MFSTVSKGLSAMALIAAAAVALPAQAAETEQKSVYANHGDLDLRTAAGVTELNHRIRRAANRACNVSDARDVATLQKAMECRRVAVANAAQRVELAIARAKDRAAYAARGSASTGNGL
ncbi:hypothetical protein CLG96_10960 [Sphingomonas oleivorans]|uniref:UrcA family protein n=1 Tax=Sphingomonas oleivorans TaxID=1735121 RepID=A0A2T5FXM1_9SPHN|nr:UrcA family protein [Sphingomonas oleivorans]PTQ10897.1 hypothetical protein CLG96_10960 [Sphingomonas oleivorans]